MSTFLTYKTDGMTFSVDLKEKKNHSNESSFKISIYCIEQQTYPVVFSLACVNKGKDFNHNLNMLQYPDITH